MPALSIMIRTRRNLDKILWRPATQEQESLSSCQNTDSPRAAHTAGHPTDTPAGMALAGALDS